MCPDLGQGLGTRQACKCNDVLFKNAKNTLYSSASKNNSPRYDLYACTFDAHVSHISQPWLDGHAGDEKDLID